ncbi:MAG: CheY-like chemotaxis protein [Paraglaciecola sp.]|jgi:CheY-like chemotaxis protein|uniref:response regulator n=1 Tax=Polaribacter sp. TaxID=1920175 RepID=UPI003ACFE258
MKQKLNSILLIDDDKATNFMHTYLIKKTLVVDTVISKLNGEEAIAYLTTKKDGEYPQPDLIFLDINMPVMNGWEFIEEYKKSNFSKKSVLIIMLTTSLNPIERKRAEKIEIISGFVTKPLTVEYLQDIVKSYF